MPAWVHGCLGADRIAAAEVRGGADPRVSSLSVRTRDAQRPASPSSLLVRVRAAVERCETKGVEPAKGCLPDYRFLVDIDLAYPQTGRVQGGGWFIRT